MLTYSYRMCFNIILVCLESGLKIVYIFYFLVMLLVRPILISLHHYYTKNHNYGAPRCVWTQFPSYLICQTTCKSNLITQPRHTLRIRHLIQSCRENQWLLRTACWYTHTHTQNNVSQPPPPVSAQIDSDSNWMTKPELFDIQTDGQSWIHS